MGMKSPHSQTDNGNEWHLWLPFDSIRNCCQDSGELPNPGKEGPFEPPNRLE